MDGGANIANESLPDNILLESITQVTASQSDAADAPVDPHSDGCGVNDNRTTISVVPAEEQNESPHLHRSLVASQLRHHSRDLQGQVKMDVVRSEVSHHHGSMFSLVALDIGSQDL